MLFESRRILLGFRIKLLFDASLRRRNSYVFVNLSKTPTVKDLLNNIKERFEISDDIYVSLNDCSLLDSEENLVLIDANEVKILPSRNLASSNSSKTTQECVPRIKKNDEISENPSEEALCNISEPSNEKEISQPDGPSKATGRHNRKYRQFYGSVAETIKFLQQNHNSESENASVSSHAVESSKIQNPNMYVENETQEITVNKMDSYLNTTCLGEDGEEIVEKRKRKRKRKHSKKMKMECSSDEVIPYDRNFTPDTENCSSNLSSKVTRQHIYFSDEEDGEERNPLNHSFNQILEPYDHLQQISHNFSAMEVNDDTDNSSAKPFENCYKEKGLLISSSIDLNVAQSTESRRKSESDQANSYVRATKPEDDNSSSTLRTSPSFACKKPTQSRTTDAVDHGFFSNLNSSAIERKDLEIKTNASENSPLATLLMCKQLQTPVEYNVQFNHPSGISRSRKNSSVSINSDKSIKLTSISKEHHFPSTASCEKRLSTRNDDDECEVLCQFKIVDNKIELRDSNGTWNVLTEKDTLKLQLVDEPEPNQNITFQMLYLGPNMCPSMSDLICGKVISFNKDNGQLTLNILPSFINNLMKLSGEDQCLPEELIHITDNAYQLPWMAVKNPRLIM